MNTPRTRIARRRAGTHRSRVQATATLPILDLYKGFAEKAAAARDTGIKPLTEKHVEYLASWLFYTGKATSKETALVDARAQVQVANQRNAAKAASSLRPEVTCQPLTRIAASQQRGALQRHSAHAQGRLTAAVNALARR